MEEISAERTADVVGRILEAKAGFFASALTALSFNGISGDYAEFGSFGGTTMWLAHQELIHSPMPRHIWAFDSFEGLPQSHDPRDAHPQWVASTMAMSIESFHSTAESRGVPRDAYTTVAGYFEDSLPPLGADGAPADIALAYIDCDLYSSTATVLEFLEPRMKHGMIVAFDDYYCWTDTDVSGERNALGEFEAAHPEWHFHRYRDFGWAATSFVVERVDQAAN